MPIEIEAGASQNQFSMEPLAVHAFFGGQHWNGRLVTTDADLAQHGPCGETRSFSKETPSLSLRLRSVRHARPDSNVIRTRSNRVRFRSGCVLLQFECGMTKFAATA
jgi:hypothetical protein